MELGIQHESFLKTIKTHKERLERKGCLGFEIRDVKMPNGGTSTRLSHYWLNERHCIFLTTLSRNTEQVVDLKDKIEESFYQAKQALVNQIKTPQTYLEALKALVASEEEKEILKLENKQLEKDNQILAEAVDELFNYSSTLRVAKFNNVSEKNFQWRRLKAVTLQLGLEVKKVPSPRYDNGMNLYPHEAWRVAYPDVALPETTTLRVYRSA